MTETEHRLLSIPSDCSTRERLSALLTGAGFHVDVCLARDAAARIASELPLSLVLLDLTLPEIDPVDFVRRAASRRPALPIVALAERGDDERILAVIRAGAHGCMFLDDPDESLLLAVHEGLAGGRPLSHDIGALLFENLRRSRPPSAERRAVRPLTDRERAVLEQLARGLEYEDIGRTLGVSVNTVRSFVRAIYEKLDVNSRTEAVLAGLKLGLIKRTPYPGPIPL